MEWVFAHMEDPDFNDPVVPAAAAAAPAAGAAADPESVMMLTSMGFSDVHAAAALKSCGGNIERAVGLLRCAS
jgi:ubiquitin carboxyl-terminal hydrolase 5/13